MKAARRTRTGPQAEGAPAVQPAHEAMVITAGPRPIRITHPDRVLFPADGITKGQLVRYYADVAGFLLPYVADRPLTLQRWPEGIEGFSFFEKQVPRGAPDWIATTRQPSTGKRALVEYPLCNDVASLLWFANLAAITLHVWMSKANSVEVPDFLLFDLDPFEGCTIKTLAKVARTVRDELAPLGLSPFVKTTGGKGFHVLVPLAPLYSYEQAQAFNDLFARRIRALLPDLVTLERSKAKRTQGTVYFDWAQLGMGRTLVPPFVVRARPGAPVSTPLEWSEVEALERKRSAKPTHEELRRWNMTTVPALLAERGDPWKKAFAPGAPGAPLERALAKARELWGEDGGR
ncbi:MAG: non-homologous end-joining DNA ligase [Myxococcota bacterium]|nr:non-homologous end-joining DNA ligase [Myxococcota bacterium]